ncbi:MAG: hypothetical protein U1E76_23105 [Planctomycetota bacterium]
MPWPSPPSVVNIPIGSDVATPLPVIMQEVGFKTGYRGNVSNPAAFVIE